MDRTLKSENIITPHQTLEGYWSDVLEYRDLFYFLAWRDILIRYKQTLIGIAWSVLRPLVTMIVLTIVFGKLAGLPSGGTPYPILVFAALLPWHFFATALSESSNSLVSNANLISKVYFPRLILPVSAVIVSLVDFFISLLILVGFMLWFHHSPGLQVLLLPGFTLLALLASLGLGFWFAPLNARYRDFRFIVAFLVQFGLYISPVGFSSAIIPEKWRLVYSLNPMVGVIDGFRWSILGEQAAPYIPGIVISLVLVVALFVSGLWYFHKAEESFPDII